MPAIAMIAARVGRPGTWTVVVLAFALVLGSGVVTAKARAQEAPHIEIGPPGSNRIETRMEPPPNIKIAPLTPGRLVDSESAEGRKLQQDLRALQQQAERGRPVGSTPASARAAWLLGLIYLHGAGVPSNGATAENWFKQAAAFGREPWAQAGLAWCAMDGCVGAPDPDAARRAIARLRATHPARADYLEWVLTSRQTPLQVAPVRNTTRAMTQPLEQSLPQQRLLERAAAEGDVQAKLELALNDVANNRVDEALRTFNSLAKRSRAAKANAQLLEARSNTNAVLNSPLTAQASADDLLAAARAYHRGDGRPANYAEAIRLYRMAADKGNAEARKMLELIYSRPTPDGTVNLGWMQQLAYANTATIIPTVGVRANTTMLYRAPTPLFDLMPDEWQDRVQAVGR